MKFETEVVLEKQKALIIAKTNYPFIQHLKTHLKKFSVDYFFSSLHPKSFKVFDYIFVIGTALSLKKVQVNPGKKFIFIFLNNKTPSELMNANLGNIKIIEIGTPDINAQDIDKILWFAFSTTKEKFLRINWLIKKDRPFQIKNPAFFMKYLTKKNILLMVILGFIFFQILFIPFALLSSLFVYRSYSSLKSENYSIVDDKIVSATYFNQIAKTFYSAVRPTYLLFGISVLPDNIMSINDHGIDAVTKTKVILTNAKEIQSLIFTKNKSSEETDNLKLRFQTVNGSLDDLANDIDTINQKLDLPFSFVKTAKNNLLEASDLLVKSKKLLTYFESIIAKNTESKYLIFFANNMELRPGGGFLGSFAILRMKNYEISDLKVYDVYDADGQLTAHVDPPQPIAKYLNLPHWFLRDSDFSPDFLENYQKALFFIQKELNITDFNGGILLTTTAVQNVLTAFNNIYIPDFKETINADNFYLKTQFYAEKNFFPGSIQKQVFLSSVVQQIILNLKTTSLGKLLSSIKKSLDEKQIVVYLNDASTQSLFDSSFWSGRVIEPKCLTGTENCLIDYLFPYDANLGANKANFFINRSIYLKTTIDSGGKITHLLSIQYENNSPSEIFPTGYYRNYFQILLPENSVVKQITKDGVLVDDYDQKDDKFKQIGFYFEVPPKKTVEIKISYQLNDQLKSGGQIYQLVLQKQIGASNSDLILDFRLDKNISLINQNFSPLVKDDQIIYNTNLSTDKIFFIELSKQ